MPVKAYWIMCKEQDQQRLNEDRKAVQDAIKRALALDDKDEVNRLASHLEWLNKEIRKGKK